MPVNRLIHEKSPYLLQHAHNPVDWRPWGEEAFGAARERDVPIFLSVGYSTCHWCHVMERESFESPAVAERLNRFFVPIKVDREERPDVDRIYMLFVQATTGSGGWPMSIWLTPDLRAFYGGTYFPPDARYGRPGFLQLLEHIAALWHTQRDTLVASAGHILDELNNHACVGAPTAPLNPDALAACYSALRNSFDSTHGGFGGAPKFPRPVVLNFLFRHYHRSGNEDARNMALLTLREMARGGMHDQLGGGFHRYSVDDSWFVPHFEKMLYDQAQLAVSYLEAFQITGESLYAGVARDIFEYVLGDLRHPAGGFYCAEDADSVIDPSNPHEKGEGAFYIWSRGELDALLGTARAASFARHFGCLDHGNVANDPHAEFAGRNILYQAEPGFADADFDECKRILLDARAQRPRPHLDDKVLTSWNALMISAFARGAQVFAAFDPAAAARYRDAATAAWRFLMENLYDAAGRKLYRRWRDGERAIDAFLDDYAALVQAHLDLYEMSFDPCYLELARSLADAMLERFEDPAGGLYSAVASADLVLRLKEDYDGAEPAGNSLAAGALLRLAAYTRHEPYRAAALRLLNAFAARLNQQPLTLPQMLCAWIFELSAQRQVVLAGPAPEPFLAALRSRFLPATLVFVNPSDGPLSAMRPIAGRTAAYVCENYACQLPVTTVEEFTPLLENRGLTSLF
jgi:hypothetical protein